MTAVYKGWCSFADWLLAQAPEMKFVPRVIVRCIRECAKEKGNKLH